MQLSDFLELYPGGASRFAGAIGVSYQAVWRYLAGERIPAPDVMVRIKEVTKGAVTADDFYGEVE